MIVQKLSIDKLMSYSFEGLLISEHFTDIISKIGENIVINKIEYNQK